MGNSVKTIKDFLEWKGPKGEKPEEYDFKRNMCEYYQSYEGKVRSKLGDEAYEKLINSVPYVSEEKSSIEEWLAYKTADAEWSGKRFDCDNSNTTCTLMRLIYVLLWNWGTEDEDKASQALMAFEDKQFGGDAMNSFATTFNEYMRLVAHNAMSAEKIAMMFSETGAEFWQNKIGKEFWNRWNKFAENTHCIGNFVLVPYYFNRYRYGKTKDYWDLSLDLLRRNNGQFDKKNTGWTTDQKSPDAANMESMPIDWDKKDFKRYINMFFLWDFVKYEDLDENGNPKPRWLFDRKREGNLLPQEQIDFQNFIDNANLRVERRSRFMVAMLKIASGMKYDGKSDHIYHGEYQEEWKDWNATGIYKEFVEKVFMKEEVYAGYGAVIDQLKEVADKIVQEDSQRKWIESIMDDLKDLN